MSTATETPVSAPATPMRKVIDDQRAAEVAGRNLYQTFKASIATGISKGRGWFARIANRLGLNRLFGRAWEFISPWLSKGRDVASRVGILPSAAYALTTHRGRHYLLSVIPERAYRVVISPVKLVGRAITWAMDKIGYGSYAESFADSFASLEDWVGSRVQDGRDWLDHHHSTWGMRIVRNALFAVLAIRTIAFLPSAPMRLLAMGLAMFIPTSEVQGNPGEVYADSIGYSVFDAFMALLGRIGQTTPVDAGGQRAPKPSDLARMAGAQAEADAKAAGANRVEARRIGRMTRQHVMDTGQITPAPGQAPVLA